MIMLKERRDLGHLKQWKRKTVIVLVLEGGMKRLFLKISWRVMTLFILISFFPFIDTGYF